MQALLTFIVHHNQGKIMFKYPEHN